MLQEKALQFVKDLGNTEFKASRNCLESFFKHSNIAFYVKSGEKAHVDVAVVEDSKEKLSTPLKGYMIYAVYLTWMRQASFSVQMRTKLCIKKVKNAVVVTEQKYLTIYLSANMVGDKETPLVL